MAWTSIIACNQHTLAVNCLADNTHCLLTSAGLPSVHSGWVHSLRHVWALWLFLPN